MKTTFPPQTYLGKWSVGLIIAFFSFWGLLILLAAVETSVDNLWVAILGFAGGISGISSFIVGLISIVRKRERSASVFLAVVLGLFVLIFVAVDPLLSH